MAARATGKPGLAVATLRRACMAALVLLSAAAIAQAAVVQNARSESASPAVVYAGRVAGDANSTRVYFDLDREVEFRHFTMLGPDRLVIDAPALLFRLAEPAALDPRGLVSFLRYGAISRDRSRIVLSLKSPARVALFKLEALEQGKKYRLVIDLAKTTASEYAAIAKRDRDRVAAPGGAMPARDGAGEDGAPQAEKRPDHFTIVIDPGHGGIDGGAKGRNGTLEKELTLDVAKRIAVDLEKAGPFEVSLTRTEDVFVSLRDRVAFARRNNADLVISVHADSLRQKGVRGASIYTLSRDASDALAHELAESENMADVAAGLESPAETDAVTDILADLTARETSVFSRSFSTTLVNLLAREVQLIRNPQRSAAFAVLKAPEIPGVLLEMGYLSNIEDEKLLNDPDWRESVAERIVSAVQAFFEPRHRSGR